MDRSLFNDEQNEYMDSLNEISAEQKCWCGWERFGKCYNCTRDARVAKKTCADKLALKCIECGSTPSAPEWLIFHLGNCSQRREYSQEEFSKMK